MKQILDLHIHSKFSRACSTQLTLENIAETCRQKGVDIIATGDFTYPEWFSSIKNELEEIKSPKTEASGLYKLKFSADDKIKFLLSTELALIYKDKDKVRRVHLVVHAPNLEAVTDLNRYLDKKYNIRSDGRPILGMKAPELVKLCLSINPKFLIYPAHIWTPWFAVFGSKSGFDSLEECFDEQTENIYALETGLSSDPAMNWRLSALDDLTILSNSDAHSLPNIGREANIMDLEKITYDEIYEVIKNKDLDKLRATIEFYPEEGMYHFDGHSACGVSFDPSETKKHKGICPVCGKPLVIGVMNRVDALADRPSGLTSEKNVPFQKLVELDKIIAEALNIKSRNSLRVRKEYNNLINQLGPELEILLNKPLEEIKKISSATISEGVKRVRLGELDIKPGFDGEYGVINIFKKDDKLKQSVLL